MAIPRPAILTRITIPTGGWTFKIYFPKSESFDKTATCTLAAGDYYVSGDNQSDDLLHELTRKTQAAIVATGQTSTYLCAHIDPTTHKVGITLYGDDVAGIGQGWKLAWTECTDELVDALGFDNSADDVGSMSGDYSTLSADWQHSHGWYASEDGRLLDILTADANEVIGLQDRSISADIKTQFLGEAYSNHLDLQMLHALDTHSDGVGYGEESVHPYVRNRALECWWREARKGTPFRVYRDAHIDTSRAVDALITDGGSSTTVECSSKSWATSPQEFKGRILYCANWYEMSVPMRWSIISNSATAITVGTAPAADGHSCYFGDGFEFDVFEHTYGTYVLDIKEIKKWEPKEVGALDRYDVSIPLLRAIITLPPL